LGITFFGWWDIRVYEDNDMALRDPHERGGDADREAEAPDSAAASLAPSAPLTEPSSSALPEQDATEEAGENVEEQRPKDGQEAPFTQYDGPPPTATEESPGSAESATCPDCGGETRSVLASGVTETVCVECGLVVETDDLETGPEWSPSDHDADQGHNVERATGAPQTVTMHDRGLGSNVGRRYENAKGDSGRRRQQRSRMRRLNRQSRGGKRKDRTRREGLSEIRRVCSALGFGSTILTRACYLFRRSVDANILLGRGIEQFVGAAVYAAARENNVACIPKEIAEPLRLDADDENSQVGDSEARVRNAYGVMCRELGLKIRPLRPQDHIPRMAQAIGVTNHVRHRSLTMAVEVHGTMVLNGHQPTSIAAGILYAVANQVAEESAEAEPVTQREVADATGKVTTTIREVSRTLEEANLFTDDSSEPRTVATDTTPAVTRFTPEPRAVTADTTPAVTRFTPEPRTPPAEVDTVPAIEPVESDEESADEPDDDSPTDPSVNPAPSPDSAPAESPSPVGVQPGPRPASPPPTSRVRQRPIAVDSAPAVARGGPPRTAGADRGGYAPAGPPDSRSTRQRATVPRVCRSRQGPSAPPPPASCPKAATRAVRPAS
jgi:transcription initiation factor TFIIB